MTRTIVPREALRRDAARTLDRSMVPGPLRVGVERSMVTTLAIAGPLIVAQSVPAFAAERAAGPALWGTSLVLALLSCIVIPLALLRRGMPALVCLRMSAAVFALLVGLERFEIVVPVPTTFTPWLVSLACIAFSCLAIGVRRPAVAAACSAAVIVGIVTAYDGRALVLNLIVEGSGLTALATGLIVGVGALRRRADRADLGERLTQERFDSSRRQVALEEERIRTDALLHDSVLSALLSAAGEQDRSERSVLAAREALRIVSDVRAPNAPSASRTFGRAVTGVEQQLASMRGAVRLDLSAAQNTVLPIRVADTMVSAMLQAVSNSAKHAGPMAVCIVRAAPLPGGGLRVTVRDDGRGFDLAHVAPERLGVRVSILEQMRLVGGSADVRSSKGNGTTVVLEWAPAAEWTSADARAVAHA